MTINIGMPKNWKTTLMGCGVYISLFVQLMHKYGITKITDALNDPQVWLEMIVGAGLLLSKDYNVTGGTVGQPSTPLAIAESNHAPAVGLDAPGKEGQYPPAPKPVPEPPPRG